ncbi:unnamed protein product [Protopolystoma xenopodis]|uniref:Polycystin domain-containing protein n=1 Tax=Protopolystoma xenopodis TaxID=117903 RepID=A0A448X683_9PLAT|nr:unnamed protein product [Protopolystoma xenopodis]
MLPTIWTYWNSSFLDSDTYWGDQGYYSGAGAYVDLSRNLEKTTQIIKDLFENLWLDRATRAVFLQFTLYNPNMNIFCTCRSVTGRLRPLFLDRNVCKWDTCRLFP